MEELLLEPMDAIELRLPLLSITPLTSAPLFVLSLCRMLPKGDEPKLESGVAHVFKLILELLRQLDNSWWLVSLDGPTLTLNEAHSVCCCCCDFNKGGVSCELG